MYICDIYLYLHLRHAPPLPAKAPILPASGSWCAGARMASSCNGPRTAGSWRSTSACPMSSSMLRKPILAISTRTYKESVKGQVGDYHQDHS